MFVAFIAAIAVAGIFADLFTFAEFGFVFFVLPISAMIRVYWYWTEPTEACGMAAHKIRVTKILGFLNAHSPIDGPPQRITTNRSVLNAVRMQSGGYKTDTLQVDVSDLNHIVKFVGQRILVEPFVRTTLLNRYLAKHRYVLRAPFEGTEETTVGGMLMGIGISSGSHVAGFVANQVVAYHLLLPTADHWQCVRIDKTHELFPVLPMSHGALGIVVAFELEIEELPEPKVWVTFRRHNTTDLLCHLSAFSEHSEHGIGESQDFLEAMVIDADGGVLIRSKLVSVEDDVENCDPPSDLWFYEKMQQFYDMGSGERIELWPLDRFLKRHDRSLWWFVKDYLPDWLVRNRTLRKPLNYFLPPLFRVLKWVQYYLPSMKPDFEARRIAADCVVPMDEVDGFLDKAIQTFGVFPIMLISSKTQPTWPNLVDESCGQIGAYYVDVGIFGISPLRSMFEEFCKSVYDCGGFMFLYGEIPFSYETFQKLHPHAVLDRMRQKYGLVDRFHDVWHRTIGST